ncbi:MAG: hypothetical protein WBB37_03070 [bacterium]
MIVKIRNEKRYVQISNKKLHQKFCGGLVKKKVLITIKPSRKRRISHKPTQVHRDKKKYTRKGKAKDKHEQELQTDVEDTE